MNNIMKFDEVKRQKIIKDFTPKLRGRIDASKINVVSYTYWRHFFDFIRKLEDTAKSAAAQRKDVVPTLGNREKFISPTFRQFTKTC